MTCTMIALWSPLLVMAVLGILALVLMLFGKA